MKSWKKLSTKQILDHPRLPVYEDQVELPSGQRTNYVYFRKPQAACVIAIAASGKIFVQQEYSYPPDEWLYQFPGGAFEEGEDAKACAKRELAEESSLAGELKEVGWYYTDNRRTSAKFYVFVANNLKPAKAPKDAEEEFIDFWFTPQEIEKMIASGKITNYSFLSAWALYKASLRDA